MDEIILDFAKANRILGMFKRIFVSRDLGFWKDLYVSLVRTYLEYAVQAWNPHMEADIERIERVQRRATRISFGFEILEYDERLKRFNLTTLRDRPVRGDPIEMYNV